MNKVEPVGQRTAPFDGQTMIVQAKDMPWTEAKTPGIKFKVLQRDEATGAQTLLLKFEPGAKTPLHEHTGLEQTYVIEGSLIDHDGTVSAGNFAWRWNASASETGLPMLKPPLEYTSTIMYSSIISTLG